MNHNTYGQMVKAKRKLLGLRLTDVARSIGSHKGYVSGIENGKVNPPSIRFTVKIARALKLDAEHLICLAHAEKAPLLVREGFLDYVNIKFVIAPAVEREEADAKKLTG